MELLCVINQVNQFNCQDLKTVETVDKGCFALILTRLKSGENKNKSYF